MKVVNFNPTTGGQFTAANAEELKNVINANADALDSKADLGSDGKIDPSNLQTIYFEGLEGSGTAEDPYRFTGSSSGGGGNITPPAPTAGVVDDSANTFNFTYATGYTNNSDYEYSINNGAYQTVTAKPISVGDIAISSGQLRVRVKAATGRNSSAALTNSAPFTVAGGGGSPETGTPITTFTYLNGVTATSNELDVDNPANGGTVAVGLKIDEGNTGWISQKITLPFTGTGEGGTGIINAGIGLDPFYGGSDAIDYFNVVADGTIVYKGGATASATVQNNSIVRLRATATTVLLEYSNNGGTTFTQAHSTARPAGIIRFKITFAGNQHQVHDLRGFNLTAV